MNPTAEPQPKNIAALLARMQAKLAEYDATKRVEPPPPPPAPKAPRKCRISEARQGALWVSDLAPDQRDRAGIAGDWKAQAIADLERLGGVPPPPDRRIGRPRKPVEPIQMPAGLVYELPGASPLFDPFAPSMPARRERAVEAPRPVIVQASTVGLSAVAVMAMRRPARSIGGRGVGILPSVRAAVPTVSYCGVAVLHRHRSIAFASNAIASPPARAGPG